MTTPPTDETLLQAALRGDEAAFVALYRRWQGPIYRFARQMCGSEPAAEDVVQDVFLALVQDARRYDAARGPLSAYLYGIARHLVLRRLRREGVRESLMETEAVAALQETQPRPDDTDAFDMIDRRESIEAVQRAIGSLPVSYREAIVLCDVQELPYEQAAVVIGCPIGTVRSRLHRGRALLADKLRARVGLRGIA
jgi:RNA polymerase sigma-70 factor (ECF subfamily)